MSTETLRDRNREATSQWITAVRAALADRVEDVARELLPNGGKIGGEWRVGNVQGQPGKSLSIALTGDRRGCWIDFATGQGGDLLDLLQALQGVDFMTAVAEAADLTHVLRPAPAQQRETLTEPPYIGPFYNDPVQNFRDCLVAHREGYGDAAAGEPALLDRTARAYGIWSAAPPVPGSVGEIYLRSKIPGLASDFRFNPDAVRFAPRCARYVGSRCEHHPALVARISRVANGQFQGVERIYLEPDGSDRLRDDDGRLSLGTTARGVVKISRQRATDGHLVVLEGVVKAIAALSCGLPGVVVATVGTGGMAKLPLVPGIRLLTIIPDSGGAGATACETLVERCHAAGVGVRVVALPENFADLDAFLRGDTP